MCIVTGVQDRGGYLKSSAAPSAVNLGEAWLRWEGFAVRAGLLVSVHGGPNRGYYRGHRTAHGLRWRGQGHGCGGDINGL